jgi:hypothetical protein
MAQGGMFFATGRPPQEEAFILETTEELLDDIDCQQR